MRVNRTSEDKCLSASLHASLVRTPFLSPPPPPPSKLKFRRLRRRGHSFCAADSFSSPLNSGDFGRFARRNILFGCHMRLRLGSVCERCEIFEQTARRRRYSLNQPEG